MKIIKRELEKSKGNIYGKRLDISRRLGAKGYVEQIDEFSARRLIGAELIRMNIPHPVDVIETTYVKNGVVEREYRELETLRNDEELKNGQNIFKTLGKILNKRDVRTLKTSDFIKEILEKLASDPRFAYKQISTENSKNTAHSVYIYTVLAIIVATVSLTNNLDFEAPISFSISKQGDALAFIFKIITNQNAIKNREQLTKNPKLESKLAYLCALCREDDVKSTIKIVDSSVIFEHIVREVPHETARVYAKDDEQLMVIYELLNAFNPPLADDDQLDGEPIA